MAFAIMRCKKLASMGSVAASLKHAYRERETLNADTTRTPENEHSEARSTSEAMGKLREKLPEKRRKDAVLAVEYLMTASPEWWKTATQEQQAQFFQHSKDWLAQKYGADRIITATIHRDETSPHLSAFVIPLTQDGRLSAKEFIGNRDQMRRDQTSFAEKVQDLGLERGIEGSKARHTTIAAYYAKVREPSEKIAAVDVPDPSLGDRLKPREYGEKVAQAVLKQVAPAWQADKAKAAEMERFRNRAKELENTAAKAQREAKSSKEIVDLFRPQEIANARARHEQQMEIKKREQELENKRLDRARVLADKPIADSEAERIYILKAYAFIGAVKGNYDKVDWRGIEYDTLEEAVGNKGQSPESVMKALAKLSPERVTTDEVARMKAGIEKHAPEFQERYREQRQERRSHEQDRGLER